MCHGRRSPVAVIHVQPLVAVEEGAARIVGDEVEGELLDAAQHRDGRARGAGDRGESPAGRVRGGVAHGAVRGSWL